ncbi:MAG TPA: AAA family ATPase, partial [Acidimicrobiia bacterium]
MRPRRLLMEGFLAYRRPTEVDFTEADLFVLSGPTGSGKSSVIDAMTFALYGTIPRLDDRRSVAPVISAMADRARVSFEFSVGDDVYTAVRLVERKGTGATTTEARLEQHGRGEPLAGFADEVTAQVTDLLGLSYDHFTKAVVLPQGAFADFLTDRPKDRQALLRALLDIGLFEQVMQLANARARTSEGKAQAIEDSLAKLDVPTAEQLDQARERLSDIEAALSALPTRMKTLGELEAVASQLRTARDRVTESLARLSSITAPEGLDTLEQDRAMARDRVASHEEALRGILEKGQEMDASLAAHPNLQLLEGWRSDRQRLDALLAGKSDLGLEALASALEEAITTRDDARTTLDRVRVEHAAHELREGLIRGEACPVCHAVVATIPSVADGPGQPIDLLLDQVRALEEKASETRDRLKEAEGQAKQLDKQVDEIEERLKEAPDPEVVERELATARDLLELRAETRQHEESHRAELETAKTAVTRLDERASHLRETLLAARDRVAGEEPPIPGEDVVEGWRTFGRWRQDQMSAREQEMTGILESVGKADGDVMAAVEGMRVWLAALGVESRASPDTDLALAVERRRAEITELEKTVKEATELSGELEMETARARIASSLGTHLRSNNFEAWLLEEAM